MFVFLDTNILLSFYHYTSDDLDELQKLLDAINTGAVVLVLPDQVMQEFWRNREAKIADALSRLKDQKLNLQFPQICKDSSLYPTIRAVLHEYGRLHGVMIDELTQAANTRQLKADQVIETLFNIATVCVASNELIAQAQLRVSLGNPPGKNGSLGDAVNWETLLNTLQDGQDLFFISDDRDYRSAIDDSQFSQFLSSEWARTKHSNLQYYKNLSSFFAQYYPNIRLANEREEDKLIDNLATAGSFSSTHSVISKLEPYLDFTDDQVNRIVDAILSNNQVNWIIDDEDVNKFARRVVRGKEQAINDFNLSRLKELLQDAPDADLPSPPSMGEELPF